PVVEVRRQGVEPFAREHVGDAFDLIVEAPVLLNDDDARPFPGGGHREVRSEEHTSELQSRFDLVCRLLLEKKKKIKTQTIHPSQISKNHSTHTHTAKTAL